MIVRYRAMILENFNSAEIVYYDAAECGYNTMSGAEWMRRDREDWLHRRMPTRLMLEVAENHAAATQRLKEIVRYRQVEPQGAVAILA